MKRNKQWDIRGAVALAGLFHFLHSCGRACLLPFFTLYLRHLGLTASMTGIVMGTKHLIALVWRPLSSLLARHYDKRRAAVTGSLVCSAGAALALLLLPSTGSDAEGSYCNVTRLGVSPTQHLGGHPSVGQRTTPSVASAPPALRSENGKTSSTERSSDTFLAPVWEGNATAYSNNPHSSETSQTTHENLSVTSGGEGDDESSGLGNLSNVPRAAPQDRRVRSLRKSKEVKQQEREMEEARYEFLGSLNIMDVQHQLFFLVLIVVALWEVAAVPLEWTADDGLYEYLDFVDATEHYGSTRLWRLLGAACGAGGAGLLVSSLGCVVGTRAPRSVAHFYSYALLGLLTVPAAVCLPLYLHRKRERASSGALKALELVRGDPRALLCAATALLTGMVGAGVEDFLLWQMQDSGATELHMGIALAVALLCQAAFAPLSVRLARLLRAHGRVLLVGATCLALQCLYYSFLWAPWAVLPAQLLSSLSGGALWWAVRAQCQDVATPGTERAVQRVYQALALDLGAGLGSFAAGFVVQRFGAAMLFRGLAVTLQLWCVCLVVLQWKLPRQRRINYSRLLAAEASEVSDSESEQERDWLEKAMEDDKGNNNNWRRLDR